MEMGFLPLKRTLEIRVATHQHVLLAVATAIADLLTRGRYQAPGSSIIHSFILMKGRNECSSFPGKGSRKAWPNARLKIPFSVDRRAGPQTLHSLEQKSHLLCYSLCNKCKVILELVLFPLRDITAVLCIISQSALGEVALLDYPFPSCLPPCLVTLSLFTAVSLGSLQCWDPAGSLPRVALVKVLLGWVLQRFSSASLSP